MIRTLILLSSAIALAACSEAPAEKPADAAPTQAQMKAVLEKNDGPKLLPPDRDVFAEKFAAACPSQKPVNKAFCRAAGMGSHDFNCEYGLGKDEYMRHEGVLSEAEGEYVLLESEKVCAQGA